MVLESLIGVKKAQKSPWELFLLGILYSSIGLFFAIWIFEEQSSLIMVFLTVLATTPLMHRTMRYEEKQTIKLRKESSILKEHSKTIAFLLFLFLGFVFSLSVWYIVLPENTIETTFKTQINTLSAINAKAVSTSSFIGAPQLTKILFNNLKVLIFCILFSFFYGMGAIFILVWNASVISAAVGTFFRNKLGDYAGLFGFASIANYLHIFSWSFFRYMIHGIFEIASYFVGALAAGIISVAIVNHELNSKKFKYVFFDTLYLIGIAIIILVIAAFIEVYITPVLF